GNEGGPIERESYGLVQRHQLAVAPGAVPLLDRRLRFGVCPVALVLGEVGGVEVGADGAGEAVRHREEGGGSLRLTLSAEQASERGQAVGDVALVADAVENGEAVGEKVICLLIVAAVEGQVADVMEDDAYVPAVAKLGG